MDVDTVVQSLEERDKWRGRLALLRASLNEVREHERRVELRLRGIKRELAQLGKVSDAILDQTARLRAGGSGRGRSPTDAQLTAR